jgi:hypothetical protein
LRCLLFHLSCRSGATTTELAAEFTGSTLFQIIGGAAPAALAAPANGLALMAMSEWRGSLCVLVTAAWVAKAMA